MHLLHFYVKYIIIISEPLVTMYIGGLPSILTGGQNDKLNIKREAY